MAALALLALGAVLGSMPAIAVWELGRPRAIRLLATARWKRRKARRHLAHARRNAVALFRQRNVGEHAPTPRGGSRIPTPAQIATAERTAAA